MKQLIAFLITSCFLFSCSFKKDPIPTCKDGVRNQNERAVDCGGVCDACPTCDDNIRNQNETSIDCGGDCKPCATCFDKIQNQDETEVDCGGVCEDCGTCSDGIKNQAETGIDCGGECEPCFSNYCATPLGYGENGYLPNSKALFTGTSIFGNEDQTTLTLEFPLSFPCKQYEITFYKSDFLFMPVNTTQLFIVDYQDENKINKCGVRFFMQLETLNALPGGKVYVTRTADQLFNIRFCTLAPNASSTYTLNTRFSANTNFNRF